MALWMAASLSAQTGGRVAGRITGEGAGAVRGDVLAVSSGGAVRMESFATDEGGAFRFELPAGRVLLVARSDGYVSEQREVIVSPGSEQALADFVLAPAGSISGWVFDEAGAAVPGARVWIDYSGDGRVWRLAEETGGEPADSTGRFTVPSVARGRPFVLHAEADGRLPSSSGTLVLRGGEMPGIILLVSRRGATVRGRVVDAAGVAVSAAAVRLRVRPAPGVFTAEQRAAIPFARKTNRAVVSAADGSFVFYGVPSGQAVVTAEAGGRHGFAETTVAGGQDRQVVVRVQ
jgi:hypothetical protein